MINKFKFKLNRTRLYLQTLNLGWIKKISNAKHLKIKAFIKILLEDPLQLLSAILIFSRVIHIWFPFLGEILLTLIYFYLLLYSVVYICCYYQEPKLSHTHVLVLVCCHLVTIFVSKMSGINYLILYFGFIISLVLNIFLLLKP